MKKLYSVVLDCDDVLMPCTEYAVKCANADGYDVKFEDYTSWGRTGTKKDIIFDYFNKEDFWMTQPVYPKAKEFVSALCKIADVSIFTAPPGEFMSIRYQRLRELFPCVPADNIIMGSRKDLVHADIQWDDAPHNYLKSSATYPILCRRPWNANLTGILATNKYDEFMQFVKEIIDPDPKPKMPYVIALVGPSGSGKTSITELLPKDRFEKVISTTTRLPRAGEKDNVDYHFLTRDNFQNSLKNGDFFENTIYAGELYGTRLQDFGDILKKGKNAVIPIDIVGAMSLKLHFPTVTVYVDRPKEELVRTLLRRDITEDNKIKRLLSLDAEEKNMQFCDITLENTGNLDAVAGNLVKLVTAEKSD